MHGRDGERKVPDSLGVYALDGYLKHFVLLAQRVAVVVGIGLARTVDAADGGHDAVNALEVLALCFGGVHIEYGVGGNPAGENLFKAQRHTSYLLRESFAVLEVGAVNGLNRPVLIGLTRVVGKPQVFFFLEILGVLGVYLIVAVFVFYKFALAVFEKQRGILSVVKHENLPHFGESPVLVGILVGVVPVGLQLLAELDGDGLVVFFKVGLLFRGPDIVGLVGRRNGAVDELCVLNKVKSALFCLIVELILERAHGVVTDVGAGALHTVLLEAHYFGGVNGRAARICGVEVNVEVEKYVLYGKRRAVRELDAVFDNEFVNGVAAVGTGGDAVVLDHDGLVVAANDVALFIGGKHAYLRHSHDGGVVSGSCEKRVENAVGRGNTHGERTLLGVILLIGRIVGVFRLARNYCRRHDYGKQASYYNPEKRFSAFHLFFSPFTIRV